MEIEKVKSALSCLNCIKIPKNEIFLCLNGHSVCHSCRNLIKKCPDCNKLIGTYRNYAAEEAIQVLRVTCENCQESLSLHEYDTHIDQCVIPCILCEKLKSPVDLIPHLKKSHELVFQRYYESICFVLDKNCDTLTLGFKIKDSKILIYVFSYRKTVKKIKILNLSLVKKIQIEGKFGNVRINEKLKSLEWRSWKTYRVLQKPINCNLTACEI